MLVNWSGSLPRLTKLLTTAEAAAILGVTPRRVLNLVKYGRLPASRFGWVWLIKASDLKKFQKRPPGRPKSENLSRNYKKTL